MKVLPHHRRKTRLVVRVRETELRAGERPEPDEAPDEPPPAYPVNRAYRAYLSDLAGGTDRT